MVRQISPVVNKIIIFSAFIVSLIFIFVYGFKGSAGSARYLLSAIGQSLAAIVALSFTVPLIAIQLVGSRYGIKVYDLYFDKYAYFFIALAITSTIFPFVVLSQIHELDAGPLTDLNNFHVTISLSLFVLTLLCLVVFLSELKEKLKPEIIIKSYRKEIESFISKGDKESLDHAHERVNTLKGIGIAAARERDDATFNEFLATWLDLLMFSKISWIQNVLGNSLPDIFKIIAVEDDIIAKRGLDALEVKILQLTNEVAKVKLLINLFPDMMEPLIKANPEVVSLSLKKLRSIGQMGANMSKSQEAPEIAIECIQALSEIGERATMRGRPELTKESLYEITNIIHHHLSIKEIVERGIGAIVGFKLFYFGDISPLKEFPKEIMTYANDRLIEILDSVSTGSSKNLKIEYRIEIANLIAPHVDVHDPAEASSLVIIASRFLKDDEKNAEGLIKSIARIMKEANTGDISAPIREAKEIAKTFNWDLPIEYFYEKYLF